MSILSEFFSLFNANSSDLSERVQVVECTFTCNGNELPPIENIKCVLNKFPIRDEVKIRLYNDYEETIIFDNHNDEIIGCEVEVFYQDSKEDTEVNISLEINKMISQNTLSVYNFEKFSNSILNKSNKEILGIFSDFLKNKEYLIFELYDSNLLFWTNTMVFKNYNQNTPEIKFLRSNKIEICKQISSFYNVTDYELIPDDFEIISNSNNNIFEEIFSKLRTLMSMIYVSNTAIIDNKSLNVEIIGQRKTCFNYNINTQLVNNDELYKIYKWIFTDGNSVDKAIIARNIISLHCQYDDILRTDQKTFSSIQSNFSLYQRDNVVKYIELKNKLGEYIIKIVTETNDIVIGLTDKFKKNIIACFTFIFTIVLANIVSSNPLNNIFTKDITFLLETILVGSIGYLVISVLEMNYNLKKLERGYEDLKNNYTDILDANDILEIFNNDKTFKDNVKDVKKKRILFTVIWVVAILVCFIGIKCIN
ncbi:TPA: hypothetical protein KOQ25_002819 [Clostridioides difficile]|uniref:hypothetical protein n=1 Tax=Clostridioides difficile TaxID=1496 RepID=UPI0003B29476|nr:hypothetical protein [Clostridioides difficile]CCL56222.1 conserved membrane hypothetical protein [Clostridioides difficile T17]HBF3050198.1 hypothetical protein [Clostridioides difficile]HBF5238631.1 hypothetical protein [Clostridioides difficile]HBF5322504.1 hypothetical protein [Clostridioides difficile]HBF8134365.1 hypothetical protein [Clostridioides difficile]